jgi:signal transduction histidine kinase
MTATKPHADKTSYLRVTRSVLQQASGNPFHDGAQLTDNCLTELASPKFEDPDMFPPALIVVMATVHMGDFSQFLAGIQSQLASIQRHRTDQGLAPVPVIGCSVAGILTDEIDTAASPADAAMVLLASRFLSVKLGVARNVTFAEHRSEAIADLCHQLGVYSAEASLAGDAPESIQDPNPHGNRFLLCFLPGFLKEQEHSVYEAVEIQRLLRKATASRIPMVGGVSGDDLRREKCWQFANDQVLVHDAVVALMETDIRFGIGMAHGLEATGQHVYVGEVAEGGRRIKTMHVLREDKFEVTTPQAVLDAHQGRRVLFGGVTPEDEGERVIFFPHPDRSDFSIKVTRSTLPGWPLEILYSHGDQVHRAATMAATAAVQRSGIAPFHLGCLLGFSCISRYERPGGLLLDIPQAVRDLKAAYPDVPVVAGLVYGEIGLGELGRSLMRNFNVSMLALSDELPHRVVRRLGYEALAKASKKMAESRSVREVITAGLDALVEAGFPGGMLSLVFADGEDEIIAAQEARGAGWKRIVDATRRRKSGKDLLAVVARKCRLKFIPDARNHELNDQAAVEKAKVISFVVLRLEIRSPESGGITQTVGLLQVDLGDSSNRSGLPRHIKDLLETMAGQLATALSRAIRLHELALSEHFDRAAARAMTKPTIAEAAQEFINVITKEPDAHGRTRCHFADTMVHVRLVDDARKHLELVAGTGDYYKAISQLTERQRTNLEGKEESDLPESPTAMCFRKEKSLWINDAEHDPNLRQFIAGQPDVGARSALEKIRSYAVILIRSDDSTKPLGAITLAAAQPWFFSESVRRSMVTLGQRLFFALEHARKSQGENRRAIQMNFVVEGMKLSKSSHPRGALLDPLSRLANAVVSDKVSLFLWDPERQELVLRAEHGWYDRNMVGKASYQRGMGMTGRLAFHEDPVYIPDLAAWRRKNRQPPSGRYQQEMFGDKTSTDRYEVITIPFRCVDGLEGVLTLQNSISPSGPATKFAIIDGDILKLLTPDIISFVSAKKSYEEGILYSEQDSRLRWLMDMLLDPIRDEYELGERACEVLTKLYSVEAAAILLRQEDGHELSLCGSAGFTTTSAFEACKVPTEVWGLVLCGDYEAYRLRQNEADASAVDRDPTLNAMEKALASGRLASLLVLPLQEIDTLPIGCVFLWNIRSTPGEEYPWFTKRNVKEFQSALRLIARGFRRQTVAREEKRLIFAGIAAENITHYLLNCARDNVAKVLTLVDDLRGDPRLKQAQDIEGNAEQAVNESGRCLATIRSSQPARLTLLPLKRVLQHVASLYQGRASEKSCTIHYAEHEDILIRGVEQQLIGAFGNLVENSVRFLPQPGSVNIEVHVDPPGRTVITRIIDDGKGISDEDIQQILDPQPRRGTAGKPRLGAMHARFVFEQHGGSLDYERNRQSGTVAVVCLPLRKASSPSP